MLIHNPLYPTKGHYSLDQLLQIHNNSGLPVTIHYAMVCTGSYMYMYVCTCITTDMKEDRSNFLAEKQGENKTQAH